MLRILGASSLKHNFPWSIPRRRLIKHVLFFFQNVPSVFRLEVGRPRIHVDTAEHSYEIQRHVYCAFPRKPSLWHAS